MLNLKRLFLFSGLWSCALHAPQAVAITQSVTLDPPPISSTAESGYSFEKLKKSLGITYFTFFYGPGIHPETILFNPNQLGKAQNDGMYFQNQVSFRYKFSERFAFDFQNRFNLILNNSQYNSEFKVLRWESPRVGISGKLASGNEWSLIGVINSDFPYLLPEPLSGYQAKQRTVIFNPGMFANFKWEPRDTPWSIFSVITPRYFFYTDRSAADPQMLKGGLIAENKPELIISLLPTVNYSLGPRTKITVGTSIDYRKQVISDWNPFHASLISNGDSPAWRFNAIPVNFGVSYAFSESLMVFPFISYYPIAIQRKDAITGRQATFIESTSVGMWLSGNIF